jgi:hypothetical protein
MGSPVHTVKPKLPPYGFWGACSRCGTRVAYSTLAREKLTGLLVCTKASGRAVRSCWDPWPEVYDFPVSPDLSLDAPPEPLPARWNLDDIWGAGPSSGAPSTFASGPVTAPDDATRLAALLQAPPYYKQVGKTASFVGVQSLAQPVPAVVNELQTIVPSDYDGTFIPSASVRTVTPPIAATELANVNRTDKDVADPLLTPPWAARVGV